MCLFWAELGRNDDRMSRPRPASSALDLYFVCYGSDVIFVLTQHLIS